MDVNILDGVWEQKANYVECVLYMFLCFCFMFFFFTLYTFRSECVFHGVATPS